MGIHCQINLKKKKKIHNKRIRVHIRYRIAIRMRRIDVPPPPLIRFNRRYKYNASFDRSFKFVNDTKKPFFEISSSYREFQYFRFRNKFKDKKHRLHENECLASNFFLKSIIFFLAP